MSTLQEQLQTAVAQTTADSSLLHTIIHGDASTTVTTEGGPVKSVTKVISENQTLLTGSLTTLTGMRDQAVASANAAGASEVAAAASKAAAALSASAAHDSEESALNSKLASAVSEANSLGYKNAAGASTTAAAQSEANSAVSATAAVLSRDNAAASEAAAGASAASASQSAGIATASAADALASAAAAAGSAAGQLFSDVIDVSYADSPFTVPASANGHLYRVNTSGGSVVINLPSLAVLAHDFRLGVAKATGDTNTVTVSRSGSDTINGLLTRTLSAQYNIDTFIGDKDNLSWLASGGGLGAINISVQRFSGTGTQKDFTLSGSPGSKNNTYVFISGVYQQKDTYEVSGATLSFGEAPPVGIDNVEVVFGAQAPIGVPADNAVGTVHLKDGAVTLTKMASGTANKLLGYNGSGAPSEVDAPQAFLPGMMLPYAGSAAPNGWLLCAGQTVSRTAYAALFAVIGTTYGAGDGSSTFALPDLRGRSPIGLDNMAGTDAGRLSVSNTLGGSGGSQTKSGSTDAYTLTIADIPSHNHNVGTLVGTGGSTFYWASPNPSNTAGIQTSNTGGGGPHSHGITNFDVLPPYLLLNYIIKT
jgi:microcystin-dependent protein